MSNGKRPMDPCGQSIFLKSFYERFVNVLLHTIDACLEMELLQILSLLTSLGQEKFGSNARALIKVSFRFASGQ